MLACLSSRLAAASQPVLTTLSKTASRASDAFVRRARSTTHSVTRSNRLRIATGRKARATTVRATFFDRLKKSTDDDVDAEGEAGDGEDEGEGGEARKMIERRASGASLDIDDAMASFNEFGSGICLLYTSDAADE